VLHRRILSSIGCESQEESKDESPIEGYVQGLDIPAEIVWGMNDPTTDPGLLSRSPVPPF